MIKLPKQDEVLFELVDGIEYATLHADTFRTSMRERDMLRAEREVWANVAQERNELRVENKQLQGDVMDSDHNELVQLRAEARRLTLADRQWANIVTRLRAELDDCIERASFPEA